MSESQSRYSIVERLTERKLNLISAKSELDEGIRRKEQDVEDAAKQLEDFRFDSKREAETKERQLQREFERAQSKLKVAREQKVQKEKAYDMQLKAVEEALHRIEEVSKAAATQQGS